MTCEGKSQNPRVRAGDTVEVVGLPGVNGVYGVIEARHRWTHTGYENRFLATPAKRWLPAERPLRPSLDGLYPARVTANHDPHNQGRIRVSYYWQEDGETTWVRRLSPHAGPGRGFLFLPEVGDEVLICFEEGDPERPYVVGSAWNGVHQPPTSGFHVPGEPNGAEFVGNNIKRLVTKSGHRITMVDTPGKETVSIATPSQNKLVLTEYHADTGRPAIVLATAGDLILSAPNGRIHSHSATHSREIGVPALPALSSTVQAHMLPAAAKPAFYVLTPDEQAKLPKKDRVAYRRSLIASGRDKAGAMPPGKDRNTLLAECSQFESDNKAVENARLSAAVYSPANAPGGAGQVEGWDRVDPSTLKGKLSNPDLWNSPSGMQAALFRSQTDGNYVVAYKGTSTAGDFGADASQSMGMGSKEYQDAMKLGILTSQDQEISPSLTFTGHSLGGGEAASAAIVTQKPAETFNAAGIHQATLTPYGASLNSADQYVQNYQVPDDIVSKLQGSTMDSILRSMAVGGLEGSNPSLAQQWMDPKTKFTYSAAGKQIMLPVPDRTFTSSTADGFPIEVTQPAGMVDRHLIGTVIESIESRKAENSGAIAKAVQ